MDKKIIEKVVKEFFEKLETQIDFTIEDKEGIIVIKTNTPDTGILIGYHGETLSALQLIISILLYKKQGIWTNISLRIGDYIERREENLKEIAQRTVEKVLATKNPVVLPFLRSDERRVIHLFLQDHPDVVAVSEGEGSSRRLVISPKN